jgi:hypothetical protein
VHTTTCAPSAYSPAGQEPNPHDPINDAADHRRRAFSLGDLRTIPPRPYPYEKPVLLLNRYTELLNCGYVGLVMSLGLNRPKLLFDCLFKRLALVIGYDHADVLQALSNYVDRPPNHGSIGKLTCNLVKAAIRHH